MALIVRSIGFTALFSAVIGCASAPPEPNPQLLQTRAAAPGMVCFDFTPFPSANWPNPWTFGPIAMTGYDDQNPPQMVPNLQTVNPMGLDCEYYLTLALDDKPRGVEVTVSVGNAPVYVGAYDAHRNLLDQANIVSTGIHTVTLQNPDDPIAWITITSNQRETYLRKLCYKKPE